MTKEEIAKIREIPIKSVAERLGLAVKVNMCQCPYHEDHHPSASIYRGKNYLHCFVCGAHANPVDLTMKVLGKSFTEACEWLANKENINLTHRELRPKEIKRFPPDVEYLATLVSYPSLNAEASRFLFEERHLNPEVIRWCGISSISQPMPCRRWGRAFYDAPSLLFPYKDIDGRVLNVQSRYLGQEKGVPRFRFPSNSSIHVFNLPILKHISERGRLWISEGITDCLAMCSSGKRAIAIPSATLLKPEDLEAARKFEWHCAPDRDAAGEHLFKQLTRVSLELGVTLVRHELPEGCKDYSDYWVLSGFLGV